MSMLGLQTNAGSAQSAANSNVASLSNQYSLGQQGMWTSMLNSMMGNAGKAAEAGAQAGSDRRLKTDVVQIGTTPEGYPWYSFNYVWGTPGEGVMSDEVPAEWVKRDAAGFDVVDYSKVK